MIMRPLQGSDDASFVWSEGRDGRLVGIGGIVRGEGMVDHVAVGAGPGSESALGEGSQQRVEAQALMVGARGHSREGDGVSEGPADEEVQAGGRLEVAKDPGKGENGIAADIGSGEG